MVLYVQILGYHVQAAGVQWAFGVPMAAVCFPVDAVRCVMCHVPCRVEIVEVGRF